MQIILVRIAMLGIFKIFVILSWILMGVLFITGFIWDTLFFKHLKKEHSEKWNELGRPTIILNNSIKNNISMSFFIKNREYEKLNDPELTRLGNKVRRQMMLYLPVAGFAIVCTTILIIIG